MFNFSRYCQTYSQGSYQIIFPAAVFPLFTTVSALDIVSLFNQSQSGGAVLCMSWQVVELLTFYLLTMLIGYFIECLSKSFCLFSVRFLFLYLQFSSVQSLSHVWPFATPWIAARQASLSITNSRNLPKPMPTESVMPSSHLSSPSPPAPNPTPPASGSFPMSHLFAWGGISYWFAYLFLDTNPFMCCKYLLSFLAFFFHFLNVFWWVDSLNFNKI